MNIYPSLFASDLTRLAETIATLDKKWCPGYHIDIMDNHFVPNLALCQKHVADIRPLTEGFLDVHIMVTDPEQYIDALVKAGADGITIHVEVGKWKVKSEKLQDTDEVLTKIKKAWCQTGIVCNPETPVASLFPYLSLVDRVLLMTVHPGYSGQKLLPQVLDKFPLLLPHMHPWCQLEIDGGVTYDHLPMLKKLGVTEVVMGSSVFTKGGLQRKEESL